MNGENFKLGLFVSVALALMVSLLLLFGMLERFKPSETAETCFFEPIGGLRPGASVRLRGLEIGRVGTVTLAAARYKLPETSDIDETVMRRSIVAELIFDSKVLDNLNLQGDENTLPNLIEAGLRARLANDGIGGPTFVQLDFLARELRSTNEIPWTPLTPYIPSAPSEIGSIIQNLQELLVRIDTGEFIENMSKLASIGPEIQRIAQMLSDTELTGDLSETLVALRDAGTAAESFLTDGRIDTLLDETSATMTDVRTAIRESEGEIDPLIDDLMRMSSSLQQAAGALDALAVNVNESGLIAKLNTLADELGPAGSDLADLARRLDRLVRDNDAQIADTIRSLRSATLELEGLLEDARANPSGMIFSEPPPRRIPEGGQ